MCLAYYRSYCSALDTFCFTLVAYEGKWWSLLVEGQKLEVLHIVWIGMCGVCPLSEEQIPCLCILLSFGYELGGSLFLEKLKYAF